MRDTLAVLFVPNSPAAIFGISTTVIIIIGAIVLVAVAAAIIGLVVLRNGGKNKQPAAPGGMPGWQGPGQPADNAWGMQPQAQQPQPGGWGMQPQVQQPQPDSWGMQPQAQQPQPDSWGMQPQLQQSQPGAWGMQPQAQQPQPGAWGSQGLPSTSGPGSSAIGSQPSWDAAPSPAAKDPWGQPPSQQQGMPTWGNTTPPSSQPGPTPYGGGQSWAQPAQAQPADPWATPSAQQPPMAQPGAWSQPLQPPSSPFPAASNPATPPWQQQGTPGMGGLGMGGAMGGATVVGQEPTASYGSNEADKTVLRNTGPQGRLGIVRVEEGKDPGRVYEVRKDSFSIGRSRESDIFLEDLAVSRLHASIVNVGSGNYALKDEGSANGTKVNGQLVTKYQTYPLQEGDKIQLGQTILVFGKR